MENARSSGPRASGSRRHRVPSPDETELWRRAVADVRRLHAPDEQTAAEEKATPTTAVAEIAAPPPAPAAAAKPAQRKADEPLRLHPAPSDLVHGTPAGIDKRTLARLRRGLIPPDAVLDLHTYTQAEAHRHLTAALAVSQSAGGRCVLVITGKGYGPDGAVGVLKTMVPRWLVEPPNRSRVLAFCHAARGHGGEGALYVLLRRVRMPV